MTIHTSHASHPSHASHASHPSPTLFMVPSSLVAHLAWEPFPGAVGVENKVLYQTAGAAAGLLRFRSGAHESAHLHLHGEHHIWVLAGSVWIDDTELAAGSYLHVPARLRHTLKDGGDGSLVFYVYSPESE